MQRGYGYQPDDGYWGMWLGDYGSRIRDRALAYALLLRHKVAHDKRENLLFDLADDFGKRNYYSTQERLALFLAVQAATNGAGKDDGWKTTLTIGAKSDAWAGGGTGQQGFDLAQLKSGLTLKNEGTAPLYLDVTAQGYPVKPLAPSSERISVERAMFTTDGKPVTARQFTTGEMFIVRLRVKAAQQIKDGLEPGAAGWRVHGGGRQRGAGECQRAHRAHRVPRRPVRGGGAAVAAAAGAVLPRASRDAGQVRGTGDLCGGHVPAGDSRGGKGRRRNPCRGQEVAARLPVHSQASPDVNAFL
jgi:hypothetical protein